MTGTSAGDGVHAYLAVQAAALREWRGPVIAREDDAVHRMRVATRRLRSVLATYSGLYAELPLTRRRLRWLADELGKVRDLEVLRTRFAKRLGEERPEWFLALEAQERDAYGPLEQAMRRERTAKLLDAAQSLAASPVFTAAAARPADEVLAPIVEASRQEMLRALARIGGAEDADEARHQARNAAKRTRYTAEAATVLGEGAEEVAAEAKKIQNRFGRCQDDAVAIAYLEAHAPDSPLLEDERRRHAKHVARAEEALAAA
ncbi:CHAD domain-containing protein [Glycomyces mayteni]|uniref:CHAD domain-containing protein n=1 Tax=Glycomyces mayteni TaxID=543887 RepID=A0ABW2D3G3_9ACTN|nr:hypothetical protein GCM10025732_55270 [Glycomyces mayteni]